MKKWLTLFIPLFCIACQDSSNNEEAAPTPEATTEEMTAKPAAETPPASTIATEVIEYKVGDQPFTGYIAYDQSINTQRPGVLVVHEWWGHNDYARTRAVQLARMGYTAFALDMYGTGKVADHPDNAMAFMQEAIKNPESAKERFLKAMDILQQHSSTDPEKIAAIGYCFGGGVVLNMARAGVDLDGVASFHGSLEPTFSAVPGEVTTKVLVLNGADDVMVKPEQIDAFKTEMAAASIDYEFINYPGAMHSFTNPIATEVGEKYSMPLAYNESADEQSWEKLREFLTALWP